MSRGLFGRGLFILLFDFDEDDATLRDGEPIGRAGLAENDHAVSGKDLSRIQPVVINLFQIEPIGDLGGQSGFLDGERLAREKIAGKISIFCHNV